MKKFKPFNIFSFFSRKMKETMIIIVVFAILVGCDSEDTLKQFPLDNDAPSAPSNATVENTSGGAIITYNVPEDEDLLYVKATYEINGGGRVTKSSPYKNTLEVDGFGDTKEYKIELRSVDRSQNESEPLIVSIHPLTPPTIQIYNSFEMQASFGGIKLTWNNEAKKDVIICLVAADSTGTLVDEDQVYTSAKDGSYALRGFDNTQREFAAYVRDRWDNYSDTLKGIFTPWFEEELDKENFEEYTLPYDAEVLSGCDVSNIWDDVISGNSGFWHTTTAGTELPIMCTFSLGHKTKLSRYKIWQRPLFYYTHNNPKVWELWGSNAPGSSGALDDGTWTKLVSNNSYKPSGEDNTTVTNEDSEYADNGEEFEFPLDAPAIKYIRFVMYENWSGGNIAEVAEMRFWGEIIE